MKFLCYKLNIESNIGSKIDSENNVKCIEIPLTIFKYNYLVRILKHNKQLQKHTIVLKKQKRSRFIFKFKKALTTVNLSRFVVMEQALLSDRVFNI